MVTTIDTSLLELGPYKVAVVRFVGDGPPETAFEDGLQHEGVVTRPNIGPVCDFIGSSLYEE